MTVVNPKSISGINSITTGSGSDNLLTIHTSDASSTERVRINSSGDVIVGSGITVSPDGDIFATGVTTSTTFVGALTGNVTGNISGGTVAGSTGTFSGAVSGTTGTFSAAVSGTTGTFSGAISGTTGTFTSHVSLGDNDQLRIGDGDDLQIYHDTSNTVLVNNTGDLYIQNDSSNDTNKILIRPKAGEASIECVPNAEVSLFHNNVEKLVTTSDGIKITGRSEVTGQYGSSHYISNTTNSVYGYTTMNHGGYMTISADEGNTGSGPAIRFRVGGGTVGTWRDGGGLCFGSDTAAANALDDYEEGTWTPVVKTTSSGTTLTYGVGSNDYEFRSGNGTSASVNYTKIGNRVFLAFTINFNSSGDTRFNISLPFARVGSDYGVVTCPAFYSVSGAQTLGSLGSGSSSFDTFVITSGGSHINVPRTNSTEVYYNFNYTTT